MQIVAPAAAPLSVHLLPRVPLLYTSAPDAAPIDGLDPCSALICLRALALEAERVGHGAEVLPVGDDNIGDMLGGVVGIHNGDAYDPRGRDDKMRRRETADAMVGSRGSVSWDDVVAGVRDHGAVDIYDASDEEK